MILVIYRLIVPGRSFFVLRILSTIVGLTFVTFSLCHFFYCPAVAQEYDLSPGKKIIIKDSTFKQGSERLEDASIIAFEHLVKYLRDRPQLDIEISGHADNQGNETKNIALSLARAEAVKQFLIARGIAPVRIRTKGYGARFPLASNASSVGQSQNRRVEIVGLSPISRRPFTTDDGQPLAPEGVITTVQRQVSTVSIWYKDWFQAQLQQPVYEQSKLTTRANSRSEITFKDQSRLEIGENALVVLYGADPTRNPLEMKENVELQKGSLLLKLRQLRQADTFSVRTKSAQVAFNHGSANIKLDDEQRSLVSVYQGAANVRLVTNNAATGKTVIVPENFGVRVSLNGVIERRALPLPPELVEPVSQQLKTGKNIKFAWDTKANRTRFEIYEKTRENADTFSATDSTRFIYGILTGERSVTMPLEAGTYEVRLWSIDTLGLESQSLSREFIVSNGVAPPQFTFHILEFILLTSSVGLFWAGMLLQQRIWRFVALGVALVGIVLLCFQ